MVFNSSCQQAGSTTLNSEREMSRLPVCATATSHVTRVVQTSMLGDKGSEERKEVAGGGGGGRRGGAGVEGRFKINFQFDLI